MIKPIMYYVQVKIQNSDVNNSKQYKIPIFIKTFQVNFSGQIGILWGIT